MSSAQYRFLVLTDHRAHRPGNPIYALLPKILAHPQVAQLHLASRGNEGNQAFFDDPRSGECYVSEVGPYFAYDPTRTFFESRALKKKIGDYEAVLMRLPRPLEDSFLENVVKAAPDAVFVNHPGGIKKTSNKTYLLNFPDICPPMRLCHSIEKILDFASAFPIVLKPLEEYGGKGILKIEGDKLYEGNRPHSLQDFLKKQEAYIQEKGYLAMKFLKNVKLGDKRIIVVGGEIMGASLRLPPEDSWLCNVAQGGNSVASQIEAEEEEMVSRLAPVLEKEGILIFGADTLVGDDGRRLLSEVNTLSVGGFENLEKQSSRPITQLTAQKILTYVDQKS